MAQDSLQSPSMTNYSQPILAHSSVTNNSNEYSNTASYSETMNIAPRDLATIDLATIDLVYRVLIQAMAVQPMQNQSTQQTQQTQQVNELRLFYQPPNDNNIYHVTCKIILQDYLENPVFWDDDDYDYEFFHQSFNRRYHVMCKLLSYPLVVNILNKEIYERDFDANDLKHKYLLTLHQKLNLELNLEQDLPFYLCTPDGSDSDGNASSFYGNITSNTVQTVPMVDSPDYFDNLNDYIAHQDVTFNHFDTSI